MKIFYYLFIFILSLSIVSAIDLCSDKISPKISCKMTTPTLICDNYTYNIYDINGLSLINDSLTVFNDSSYYFTFMQDKGTYYIRLCDNSTRQITVGDDMINFSDSMWINIVFILLTATIIFIGWKSKGIYRLLISVGGVMMMGYATFIYYQLTINTHDMYRILAWMLNIILVLVGFVFVWVGITALMNDNNEEEA